MKNKCINLLLLLSLCGLCRLQAAEPTRLNISQPGTKTLLHSGWYARKATEVNIDGSRLTRQPISMDGWMKAQVPGTVLTTLLNNGRYPAPEFGLNNNLIPDIHDVGNDFYTYWFLRRFTVGEVPKERTVWLNFRGINYKADIFLNGKRVNHNTHEGMFLRKQFDITPYLKEDTCNTLAVIVYPPTFAGDPNGGQGGDGEIARNNTMQFTPGWDWIQPVRDRNTGIWDEVSVTTTGAVQLRDPYVYTRVPGVRQPDAASQPDAFVKASIEVENVTDRPAKGMLVCMTAGKRLTQKVSLQPREKREIAFQELTVKNPHLWWPNGIGGHHLYRLHFAFEKAGSVSDSLGLNYGIREITSDKCPATGGRRFFVNGQKVYVTGGNYICSDWLLRLSPQRYRDEVRFHAEMNLRMIRVWGGALLERPEFYDACDEYGILVFQDLWGSGDCNGAWYDPKKKDSQERRQEYPDNHDLFLASAEDQVKMIRNHPSLCLWCGANEWPLARDIDTRLKQSILPRLDPHRLFISYSTDSLSSRNLLGDNGDGPYGIQEKEWFFTFRSHPFNPEAGSVGSPEVESMREMMNAQDLADVPVKGTASNYTWKYHKDLGYADQLERIGEVKDIETYCKYAQVVNYDQYRSFMEGWASHLWEWYTGILIWKTQNPWTALRGQMYDWFMDVNASFYGTQAGCKPFHAFYNPVTHQASLLNTTLTPQKDVAVTARLYDSRGKELWRKEVRTDAPANTVTGLMQIPAPPEGVEGIYFLSLQTGKEWPNNYWLTTREKDYSGLTRLPACKPFLQASLQKKGTAYTGILHMDNRTSGISFFNRIKVFDADTGRRILPVHYADNYVTLMPGEEREIRFEFHADLDADSVKVIVESWTADPIKVPVQLMQ